MAFAILKLSYNEAGDSDLEGGICGTGFFINNTSGISAHHILNEETFTPNLGYKQCGVWLVTRGGRTIPLSKRLIHYRPQVDATIIKLDQPVRGVKTYRVSAMKIEPNAAVCGMGHSSAGMPVGSAHWEDGSLVIDEADLGRFIEDRVGYIARRLEMTVHANDINLNDVSGYELSFGSKVGMSGGPLVIRDTEDVVGMLSFGLPPDKPIKTNTFAVAIEEIV